MADQGPVAVGAVAAAGVGGLLAGLASVVLHTTDWGLTLLTVTCLGALLLSPAGVVRAAGAAGWVVGVLLAARGGPGGDVLVTQGVRLVFLALTGLTIVGATAATWPRDRGSRHLSSAP